MSFQKAVKEHAKLRLAIGGPAGTGKTFSSLKIASELGKLIRSAGHGAGRIAVIDSERGSASLYADKFDFDVCEIDSFSPLVYVEKIRDAEAAGYDLIIVDSLSHAWAGKDGALEQKDRATETRGNSYTAWATVTPKQNALIDAMLGSKAHVIATMRQKSDFVQEKDDKGKTTIRKVGLAFVQRDQIEFEFTLVGEIDHEHTMKISKTRIDGIDLGDQFDRPGESFARKLYTWLMSGAAPVQRLVDPPKPAARLVDPPKPAESPETTRLLASVGDAIDGTLKAFIDGMLIATTQAELDAAAGKNAPAKGSSGYAKARDMYTAVKSAIEKRAGDAK